MNKARMIHNRPRSQTGFTLVEVAISILIIGFILSALGFAFGAYVHNVKTQTTEQRFNIVLNALSGYVQRHNRLPCPAFPTPIGTEPYGAEPGSGADGDQIGHCFQNADLQTLYANNAGIVPWRTLGLQEDDIFDGWGQYITYKPAPQLTLNTYAAEILDNPSGNDVLNACLNTQWFNQAGEHIDRAKALFCCSAQPNADYLTSRGETNTALSSGWKNNAITSAGVVDTSGLNTGSSAPTDRDVVSTNAWIDDQDNSALAGDFTTPNQDIDTSMGRAQGHAITLISHGRDGYLAFLRGFGNDERKSATVTASAYNDPNPDIAEDEAANAVPRAALAAVPNHPKTGDIGGVFDFFGLRSGASDDHIAYMTNEQLYAKAGFTASCQPASGLYDQFDPCDESQSAQRGDFAYMLDTSNSMNACAFGADCDFGQENSKIEVAKQALIDVYTNQYSLQQESESDNQYRLGADGLRNQVTQGSSNGCGTYDYQDADFFPDENSSDPVQDVVSRIESLYARRKTPLIDRLTSAASLVCTGDAGENLCDDDPTAETASLLILTDGYDTCSGRMQDIIQLKNDSFPNLEVNFIHIYDEKDIEEPENQQNLEDLADQLGGQYFAANSTSDIAQLLLDLSGTNSCE